MNRTGPRSSKKGAHIDSVIKNTLHEIANCDNLSSDVLELITHMNNNKVKEIHQYAITHTSGASSRWQTYVKDEYGTRVKVSALTEQKLYDKLYEHYFIKKSLTLLSFFPQWLESRNEQNVSARTIRRNVNHWDKYYSGHPIVKIPLNQLDSESIEKFFYGVIKRFNITVKELNNMRFVMSDMLKLAKKRGLISVNPMDDVEIRTTGCKPPTKHNDSSRVYMPDEKMLMFDVLNHELLQKPESTDVYAVFLLFKLGLRIGELVALKWEDIDFANSEIHIHRMETSDDTDGTGKLHTVIAEHTKKKSLYGDRFLPLGEYELNLFREVRKKNIANGYKDDSFIFCDSEGRTTIREIDNLIRKCCNYAGIEEKSAHDIRRTVASEMFNNGVSVEIIKDFLGHSDIKTTYGYIVNNSRKEETNRIILNSLNKLNGLKRTHVG